MSSNKLTVLGFVLFFLGGLSLILSLVGLKLDIIGFLYKLGKGFAFLIHIIFLFGGIALIFIGKNKDRMMRENEELEISKK